MKNLKNLLIVPWANCPYHLNVKEVRNPILFLDKFFKDILEKHRRNLKPLVNAAYSLKAYKNKERGTTILFPIYLQPLRLLEYCYLLLVSYRNSSGNRNKINPELAGEGQEK